MSYPGLTLIPPLPVPLSVHLRHVWLDVPLVGDKTTLYIQRRSTLVDQNVCVGLYGSVSTANLIRPNLIRVNQKETLRRMLWWDIRMHWLQQQVATSFHAFYLPLASKIIYETLTAAWRDSLLLVWDYRGGHPKNKARTNAAGLVQFSWRCFIRAASSEFWVTGVEFSVVKFT